MIGPTNAVLGSPFPITLFSEFSDLDVRAEVIKIDDGTPTLLTLNLSTSLSSDGTSVYRGDFTPSEIGWYVVQYQAERAGEVLHSSVSRFYVDQASTATGSGSGIGASATTSSGGKSLAVPAVLDGTSGTFTFTVGRR